MTATARSARPHQPLRYRSWSWITVLNLGAVLTLVALDWITPPGIVVGILIGLPVVASSMGDDPRERRLMSATALVGFLLAAILGDPSPISPARVWETNRLFAFAALLASIHLASTNQRRLAALRASHRDAVQAGELNGLLLSLLAHDLRAPLGTGLQALDYVETSVANGESIDTSLLGDVRQRMKRSVGTVDRLLEMARRDLPETAADHPRRGIPTTRTVASALDVEVRAFADEAGFGHHTLVTDLDTGTDEPCLVDALLVRQAAAILVDNAIRHSVPGEIRVSSRVQSDLIEVRVMDPGPLARHDDETGLSSGSGLGLALCRTLLARSGGSIDVERTGPAGTTVALRLAASRGRTQVDVRDTSP